MNKLFERRGSLLVQSSHINIVGKRSEMRLTSVPVKRLGTTLKTAGPNQRPKSISHNKR